MESQVSKMSYEELQFDLSKEAQKGYPMFLAGILFWFVALVCSFFLASDVLVWVYIFGVGLVLPLGILISKLLSINFLAVHNPLSTIGGLVGGVQIFFAPIVILIAYQLPDWMPFVIGVLTGAHFLPYVAIYKSKAYLFLTISTVLGSSVLALYWLEHIFALIPMYLILVYFITFVLVKWEVKNMAGLKVKDYGENTKM